MNPTNKTARLAGFLYLLLVLTGPFPLLYVPTRLIVHGDAAATAQRVLASETMFRWAIVCELAGMPIWIFLVMALYRLFNQVDKMQATLMVTFVLASVPVACVGVVNNIAALTLLHPPGYLSVFSKPQLDAMALFFVGLHGKTIMVNEIFWGLWLLPLGILIIRSRFIPRILGILLIINCFAYLAESMTGLLAPDYVDAVRRFTIYAELGELWIMLWLLIKGAKVENMKQPALAGA